MGETFLLTMVLNKQGVLRGSSMAKHGPLDYSKGLMCHQYKYDVKSQYDLGSGALTGRRQHQPVSIVREVDEASPLLWSALCTNEGFKTATLSFARPSTNGKEVVYQTIELTNGTICRIEAAFPNLVSHGAGGGGGAGKSKRFEEVSLTYESIKVNGMPSAVLPSFTSTTHKG